MQMQHMSATLTDNYDSHLSLMIMRIIVKQQRQLNAHLHARTHMCMRIRMCVCVCNAQLVAETQKLFAHSEAHFGLLFFD